MGLLMLLESALVAKAPVWTGSVLGAGPRVTIAVALCMQVGAKPITRLRGWVQECIQKFAGSGFSGLIKNLLGRTFFDHSAFIEKADSILNLFGKLHFMCHKQHGQV